MEHLQAVAVAVEQDQLMDSLVQMVEQVLFMLEVLEHLLEQYMVAVVVEQEL
jgi:hypothetical protein